MPIFDQASLAKQAANVAADPQPQAQPEPKGVGVGPYAAVAGGELADILSTLYAKNHGAHEANPVLGDFGPGAIALKSASTLPMILMMRYLAKAGHPTAAKALGYGTGAALGGVAVHNLSTAK